MATCWTSPSRRASASTAATVSEPWAPPRPARPGSISSFASTAARSTRYNGLGKSSALMSSRTRFVVMSISVPIIVFAIVGGFLGKVVAQKETYQHLKIFDDVVGLISSSYVEE